MERTSDFFKKIILACCLILAISGIVPAQNGMNPSAAPIIAQAQTQLEESSGLLSSYVEEQSSEAEKESEPEAETEIESETEIQVEAEPEEPKLPEYTVTEMSAVLYAQKASNVRSGPSTDYDVIGGLAINTEVTVVGKASTGWYQISYGGIEAFVAGSLLKDTPVVRERWQLSEDELVQLCLSECITAGMSDWDKAIAINNYLVNLMSYDYTYTHCTTFDALAYGTGVCQGYANAYQRLMNAAGIPTDYVRGYGWSGSEWGRHGWNRVLIDGQYYYVDVTWNDSSSPNRYLLISYDEISKNHQQTELNPKRKM